MKLIYGTANQAKLQHMREMLHGLGLTIVGLNDMNMDIETPEEVGSSPLENAKIKAITYYKVLRTPVFSCDSGLVIEGLSQEEQPGVFVRRVQGRVLNDEEMIHHYSAIAERFGGRVRARYVNAICLVLSEDYILEYDGQDICSDYFYLTSKASSRRNEGFPLDSISIEIGTGKYFIDMKEQDNSNTKLAAGFRNFFQEYSTIRK